MSRHALYPVTGGHVTWHPWEKLADVATASCAACGLVFKRDGALVTKVGTEPNLCPGWRKAALEMPVLPDLVRGMVREAPDDKPNGPSEEALRALSEARHEALESRGDGVIDGILEHREGDAIGRLGHALADDVRALRLALEHDEMVRKCGAHLRPGTTCSLDKGHEPPHCPDCNGTRCEVTR